MKLLPRTFVGGAALWGSAAWAGLYHMHVSAGLGLFVLGTWLISRDLYLSRWQVRLTEDGVELTHPKGSRERKSKPVRFAEICRVQDIHPGARVLVTLLRDRPHRTLTTEFDASRVYTIATPVGFYPRHAWRRLWTMSRDLLLQAELGHWMLIPLGCLRGAELRELWIQLRTKVSSEVSRNDFRQDPAVIEAAMREEEQGDKATAARQWKTADEHLEKAALLWRRGGHIDSMTRCRHHRIECLMRLGRFIEAGGLAEQVVDWARNLDNRQTLAGALNHVAEASLRVGGERELHSALSNLEEAIKIHEGRRETFMACRLRGNLAMVHEGLFLARRNDDELKKCKEMAAEALSILKEQLASDSSYMVRMQRANLEGTLAHCEFHSKEFRKAAECFARANPKEARTERGFFIEDLAMWGSALFHAWSEKAPQTSEVGQNKLLHEALFKLDEAARLVALRGDFNEALQVFPQRGDIYWRLGNHQAAIRDYETVIGLLEARKYALDRSFERTALLREHRVLYGRVSEMYLRMAQDQVSPQVKALECAFQHCERGKARGLVEGMNLSDFMRQNLPDDLRSRLESAFSGLKEAHWRRNEMVSGGDPSEVEHSQWLYQTRQAAIQDLDEVMEDIRKRDPRLLEMVVPRIPSLAEIQSHVPRDGHTGILEFDIVNEALGVFLILSNVPLTETCFFIEGLVQPRWSRHSCTRDFWATTTSTWTLGPD